MVQPFRLSIAAALVMFTGSMFAQAPAPSAAIGTAQANAALTLVGTIPAPGMSGTWDHLTVDPATGRLFASAQEDNQVRVFDLKARKPLDTIQGGFDRPQGLLYVPAPPALAVTNGRDGSLRSFDGKTYNPIGTVGLTLGADMMDIDPRTKYLYVDHGGIDSKRGPGGLAIIDSRTWKKVGEVPTEYRPGSLQIEKNGNRLFVTLPGLSQVAVVDRNAGKVVARYQLISPAQPIALALDESSHRIFIGNRKPASFNVLDMETGRITATLDSIDGIEGIFFDRKLHRLYLTALDGYVQVIQQLDADHYKTIARFFTGHHAGTSQWVPSLNLFCVAVPPVEGQTAAIWLFQPKR